MPGHAYRGPDGGGNEISFLSFSSRNRDSHLFTEHDERRSSKRDLTII